MPKIWLIEEGGIEHHAVVAACSSQEKALEMFAAIPFLDEKGNLSWCEGYEIVEYELDKFPDGFLERAHARGISQAPELRLLVGAE